MIVEINSQKFKIEDNEFNRGLIEMLQTISIGEGWEESEEYYFKKFFPAKP